MTTLNDLGKLFDVKVVGNGDTVVAGFAPLETAREGQLAFLVNPLYRNQTIDSKAGAVILSQADLEFVKDRVSADDFVKRNFLVCKNPYAIFARISQLFSKQIVNNRPVGIHSTAFVAEGVKIPENCWIGPFCYVSAGATIGSGVFLHSHVHIGENSKIGDNTELNPNVTIYYGCEIGARSIIHSGAVIGSDGFGFAPDFSATTAEWVKIPQIGRVIIGDDVEIGANTTIDRGALQDTIIENGCKIDNQVQIAHNVKVGAFTVIAGCAAIAGSTSIGKFCVVGGSANFAGHLTIADKTTVSGGTSITRSITTPGQHFTSVFPFTTHAEWEKNAAIVRGLDKIRQRVRELEKKHKES